MNFAMGGRVQVYYDLRLTFLGRQKRRGIPREKETTITHTRPHAFKRSNNHEVTRASKIKKEMEMNFLSKLQYVPEKG